MRGGKIRGGAVLGAAGCGEDTLCACLRKDARAELRGPSLLLWGALFLASILAGCESASAPKMNQLFPEVGNGARADLQSKSGSATYGVVNFSQRGANVLVVAQIFNLAPGPHSFYIHETGNCNSPNAASAGPVWNASNAPPKQRRTGDLPQLFVGTEGNVSMSAQVSGVSVGTGAWNDIVGRAVVVHDSVVDDPRPEYGAKNGWIACGIIERF